MDYQKALNILGLTPNFTEEELKKAHRKLVNEYHPDRNHSPEAEEKMKVINEAKDCLDKYLKTGQRSYNTTNWNNSRYTYNNQSNNSQSQFDSNQYIRQKSNELYNIVGIASYDYKFSNAIKKIIAEMQEIVAATAFIVMLKNLKDKQSIDNEFDVAIRRIQKRFEKLKIEFYKENGINESDVKENLNYNCTLKEFYEQLLKIKDKYSKEPIINKLLEDEIEQYASYAGYERIKPLVSYCKTATLHKIKENGFNYTQEDIEKMHQLILEQFEKYYSLEQKMKDLENKVQHINNEEIKSKFTGIKNRFKNSIKFDEIETAIKELEDLIEKNKNEIDQISKSLISRCCTKLQNYDIVGHQEQLGDLIDLLKLILNLFAEGLKQGKTLDFFKMFDEITFKSIVNDREIIDKITKKLNEKESNKKSNIYIKIKCNSLSDEKCFFYLQEDTMLMNKFLPYAPATTEKITKDDLESEYISIEEFLDQSTFIGKDAMMFGGGSTDGCSIIYQNSNRVIYVINHRFYIGNDSLFYTLQSETNPSLKPYENKEYLISLIAKQIKNSLEDSSNRQRKPNLSNFSKFYEKINPFNKFFTKEDIIYNDTDEHFRTGRKK